MNILLGLLINDPIWAKYKQAKIFKMQRDYTETFARTEKRIHKQILYFTAETKVQSDKNYEQNLME